MKINSDHLKLLKEGREIHAKRIAELRKQIKFQEEEIEAHSLIMVFGGNEELINVLNRLAEEPEFFEQVQSKERECLEKIGILLPNDCRIELTTTKKKSIRADIFVRTGVYSFRLSWDSRLGFSAVPTNE